MSEPQFPPNSGNWGPDIFKSPRLRSSALKIVVFCILALPFSIRKPGVVHVCEGQLLREGSKMCLWLQIQCRRRIYAAKGKEHQVHVLMTRFQRKWRRETQEDNIALWVCIDSGKRSLLKESVLNNLTFPICNFEDRGLTSKTTQILTDSK